MRVERLAVAGFRNLSEQVLEPHARFNLIEGRNGQGKTNLLEAIFMLGAMRSFRTQRAAECITFGGQSAVLSAHVERAELRREIAMEILQRGRRLHVDGKRVAGLADCFGVLVAVLFAPEDLRLPRASPAERRRFLDRAVFNHEPVHLIDLRTYEEALGNRNALLKQGVRDTALLEAFDEALARHGARIGERRARFVALFDAETRAIYSAITDGALRSDLVYEPSPALVATSGVCDLGVRETQIKEALAQCRARDMARGHTTVGPHVDDLRLDIEGRPARIHASQGQGRALVLAMKMAEFKALDRALGEPPVLLLDDVSSELDAQRNATLMYFLDRAGGQVFLTTTDVVHIRLAGDRSVWNVEAGTVAEVR